jgi:Nif-specific regulatory protein
LAETLIAQGHNDRALASCEKALEVSLSLGNRLEKGIVYRVMGRAHAARNHNRLARQCYQQSLACLEEIVEERYEKARSWFETGRFLCDIGEPGLAWGYLVRAQDIFSKLPAPYWEGVTHQEMARVRWKEGDFETALGLLDEAEEFFGDAGEEKALEGLQSLRREMEHSAISRSTEVRQEYEILEKFNRAMVTGEGEVESLLGLLLKRVGGSRGLVATQSDDGFKVVSTYNLDHRHAEQILEGLEHGISGYEAHQPILSTRTAEDPRFSGIVDGHVESLMLVPFGVNHEIDGLVYVDRPSGYFGPREVSSLALFANVMALHVSYLRQQELVQENLRLRRQIEEESSFTSIVAHSRQMVEILSTIDRVRDSSIPILLEGETGTGKELLARAIHYSSDRSDKPFVVVNCAALPETLLESELFGHRRGAFTGATQDKPGLVETADGGTFFLDEVSEMGGSAQAKLLRVLEQGEIQALGAVGIRKVDIRLISATNKNLEKGVKEGWLRQDLFYRLKGVRIYIPALRERREDIPLLVEHFLRREFGKKVPRVTPEVMRILMDYPWPGNVRELLNEVRRWAALAGGSRAITPDLLSESLTGGVPPTPDAVASEERSLTDRILAFERWCLAEALEKTGWVKTHAAKRLGIPEATLRLKMKRHGLTKRK